MYYLYIIIGQTIPAGDFAIDIGREKPSITNEEISKEING